MYTNLDGIEHYTPRLYGILPLYMWSVIDQTIDMWYMTRNEALKLYPPLLYKQAIHIKKVLSVDISYNMSCLLNHSIIIPSVPV